MLRIRTTLAALAIMLLLPLAACASGADGNATESGTGGDGQQAPASEGGGASTANLPEGWPADLPAPNGELVISSGENGSMEIQMRVSDLDVAEANVQAMQDAGYKVIYELRSDHGGTWALEKENRTVTSGAVRSADGVVTLTIGVQTR